MRWKLKRVYIIFRYRQSDIKRNAIDKHEIEMLLDDHLMQHITLNNRHRDGCDCKTQILQNLDAAATIIRLHNITKDDLWQSCDAAKADLHGATPGTARFRACKLRAHFFSSLLLIH